MERPYTTGGRTAARVSNELVGLLRSYTGRGPTRARTYINTNLVCVVFQDTLTRAEKNLVDAGQADQVVSMRRTFQEAMSNQAVKIVEELLQRRVLACLSDIDPHANIAADTFVLEPMEESGIVEVGETEDDSD